MFAIVIIGYLSVGIRKVRSIRQDVLGDFIFGIVESYKLRTETILIAVAFGKEVYVALHVSNACVKPDFPFRTSCGFQVGVNGVVHNFCCHNRKA